MTQDAVSTDFEVGSKASGSGPEVSTPKKKILPPSHRPNLTQDEKNKSRERKRKKGKEYEMGGSVRSNSEHEQQGEV
jgi:hypothetical protein